MKHKAYDSCKGKLYLSRKPFHQLSLRQKRRIARKNLLNKLSKIKRVLIVKSTNSNNDSIVNVNNESTNNIYANVDNVVNVINKISNNVVVDQRASNLNNGDHANLNVNDQSINVNANNENALKNVTGVCNMNCTKTVFDSVHEFKEELAALFVETNVNLSDQKKWLNLLRKHHCFTTLPKDPRSLLHTPRVMKGKLINVSPGQYLHLGFQKALTKILDCTPSDLIPAEKLMIDFNIDGCKLNKKYEIIPIQVRISNIPESNVEVVGIYKGRTKPINVHVFLLSFITDVNRQIKEKLVYKDKQLNIEIRLGSFDLVARAYIMQHKNYNSFHPCSKCKVIGIRYKRTMVFRNIGHVKRTDEEYANITDKNHHHSKSPLLKLGMGLVTQVPIDAMHCIYLGVHKKILFAWTKGTYGKNVKLSSTQILQLNERIKIVVKYCPREFARRPESLTYLKDFKATQHRQFLLYFGIAIINGIVDENTYVHYLLLSTAIRCLSLETPSYFQLSFARLALDKFIVDGELIYDLNFLSYNVHNLCHLVDDVEKFGPLESYAAWPYENNMTFFRKYYNKPGAPLEQIYNRLTERENIKMKKIKIRKPNNYIRLFNPSTKGPLPNNVSDDIVESWKMYENIEYKTFTLGVNLKDSTCMLDDLSICIVENIYKIDELIHILIRKFNLVEDLFDVGICSSSVGTYKCSMLANETELIEESYIKRKCYRMPFWKNNDEEDSYLSEDNDDPVPGVYIVSVIM